MGGRRCSGSAVGLVSLSPSRLLSLARTPALLSLFSFSTEEWLGPSGWVASKPGAAWPGLVGSAVCRAWVGAGWGAGLPSFQRLSRDDGDGEGRPSPGPFPAWVRRWWAGRRCPLLLSWLGLGALALLPG